MYRVCRSEESFRISINWTKYVHICVPGPGMTRRDDIWSHCAPVGEICSAGPLCAFHNRRSDGNKAVN